MRDETVTTPTPAEDCAIIRKAMDWIGCLDGRVADAMDAAHERALEAMERIEERLNVRF